MSPPDRGLGSRGIGWDDVQPGFDVIPMLLYLGGLYLAMWTAVPEADADLTTSFACVGVIGWPVFAGTLRVLLHRPGLRPPWWAATWLFLGVPATAVVMALRSGHLVEWVTGLVCTGLLLAPFAVWRYRSVSTSEAGEAEAGDPEGGAPEEDERPYARWGRRAAAFVIDAAILLVPLAVSTGYGRSAGGGVAVVLTTLGVLVGAGLGLCYNRWYLGGMTGQTWGRRLLRIRLVSERTGQPIGWARAFGRDLAHVVTDMATYYIGWLVPLWDAKRQTLADKMVHTVVVRLRSEG